MQQACEEVGLTRPASVVGSTDATMRQMLAICRRVGGELRGACQWPQLTRECVISLVAAQDAYALPVDFDYALGSTYWNRTQTWPLFGPISAQEWQQLQSGITAQGILQKFRVKGAALKQFYITPTPTSSDASASIAFEYQSRNWIKPADWVTGTVYTAPSYCFYNGVYFYSAAGGTSGATAPTVAVPNDGGIAWTQYSGVYDEFVKDSDEIVFDEMIVALGISWNFLAAKNLPYLHLREKYEADVKETAIAIKGAPVLSMTKQPQALVGDIWTNLPITGYGLP